MGHFLEDGAFPAPAGVILTDDPMRARMLAAHHLEAYRLVSEQRGMAGFAGSYGGKPAGVFSTGYGQAALLNWTDELARGGAEAFVYVGECVAHGAPALGEVLLATGADGAYGPQGADAKLLECAISASNRYEIPAWRMPVFTDDLYWTKYDTRNALKGNIIDFAADALYWYARQNSSAALCILSVSENSVTGSRIGEAERQSRFYGAARLAFETLTMYQT